MAGERALPGLGLFGFWTAGSNGYRAQQGSNYRVISALLNRKVLSRVTALPGSPTLGDIYIVPSGAGSNANEVAIRDYDTDDSTPIWHYLTPDKGWMFWVDDESKFYHWNGSAWTEFPVPTVVSDHTGDYAAVAADFNGRTVTTMTVGSANTFTVNSGLTVKEPATIIQMGAGQTTIVAGGGVTIHYPETLKIRGQYSMVSLVPLAADTYLLVGDVEAAP